MRWLFFGFALGLAALMAPERSHYGDIPEPTSLPPAPILESPGGNYSIITLHGASGVDRKTLVPPGEAFFQVVVLEVTAGCPYLLRVGAPDAFPVSPRYVGQELFSSPRGQTGGLFVTGLASQANTDIPVTLFISFSPTPGGQSLLYRGVLPRLKIPTYRVWYPAAGGPPFGLSIVAAGPSLTTVASLDWPATAVRKKKLRHCWVAVESASAATNLVFRLQSIVARQSGGTVETAFVLEGPTNEAVARALPTGALSGTDIAVAMYFLGATGVASVVNPPVPFNWVDVLAPTPGSPDGEAMPPALLVPPGGGALGWQLVMNSSGAATVVVHTQWEFTEETVPQ